MFNLKPLLGAALLLLLLDACHNNSKENKDLLSSPDMTTTSPVPPNNNLDKAKEIPVADQELIQSTDSVSQTTIQQTKQTISNTQSTPPKTYTDFSKKIIKNASVKLEVKDPGIYSNRLNSQLKQYGAYIAQEDNSTTAEQSETVISIKVPVENFDDLLASLAGTDDKIIERSIRSQDVSGDIVDTRARLEAKKQMRLKYLDFLKESKNMTEVLQVQTEINGIQEEIESAAGRFASLTSQSAYSTIQLTYFKTAAGFTTTDPGFWAKTGIAFSAGMVWVSNFFVGFVSVWPLWIITGVVIYFIRKRKTEPALPQKG